MSLSVARPIVTEPTGLAAGTDLGDRSLTNLVARFDASPDGVASVVTSVGGTSCVLGGGPALTTVIWSGGGPADGGAACTLVGYSDGASGGVCRTCGAGRPCGTGDGVGVAPLRREPASGPGGWAGGGPGGAVADHVMVDCASRGDALPGG